MNRTSKDTLIVIPAHNEQENLQDVLNALETNGSTGFADILVVNDASTDNTEVIARQNGIFCVSFPYNLGYGNALRAGYKYAVNKGYRYVIQMDADGQHDACNIPQIHQALIEDEENDIVLASRFMPGSAPYQTGFFLRLGIGWYRFLLRLFTGEKITDPTTGLQGFNERTFSYYAQFDHFDPRYPDANMLMQMLMLGYRIKQIPAVMHTRIKGKGMHSGILHPIIYMLRATLSVFSLWLCLMWDRGIFHHQKKSRQAVHNS